MWGYYVYYLHQVICLFKNIEGTQTDVTYFNLSPATWNTVIIATRSLNLILSKSFGQKPFRSIAIHLLSAQFCTTGRKVWPCHLFLQLLKNNCLIISTPSNTKAFFVNYRWNHLLSIGTSSAGNYCSIISCLKWILVYIIICLSISRKIIRS